MAGDDLEYPENIGDVYLARGEEVNPARPLMQGDVLDGVVLPGLDDGPGKALILTHPCSMRRGPRLADRLLFGRVAEGPSLSLEGWATGHKRVMPLPELVVGVDQPYSASFEDVSSVASDGLQELHRLACLGDHGIALLQQRFVYYLTRFVVPTDKLHQVCAPVLAESELQEEWVGRATARGTSLEEAEAEFHEFIRAPREGGGSLQASLEVASKHGFVFKETRLELSRRYGPDADSGA